MPHAERIETVSHSNSKKGVIARTTSAPVIDQIGIGIVCCDSVGTITMINRAGAKLLNCDQHEVVGQLLNSLLPDASRILDRGSGRSDFAFDAMRADGSSIPIQATVEHLPGGEDECCCITLQSLKHISESAQNTARLAAIVESSDDAIMGKTLRGVITSWNKSAERIFGYRANAIIGERISILIPPDRQQEELEIQQRLREGQRIEHFDTVRLASDGTRIDVSLTISPIRDETGAIVGASTIARDVREQRRAAAAAKEVEQRMRLAIDAGQICIWDWDIKLGTIQLSERLAQFLDLDQLTTDFPTLEKCIHPDDRLLVRTRLMSSLNNRTEYRVEYRVVRRDGTVHWSESRGHAFFDDEGNPYRMSGVLIDISDRKLAQDATSHAEYRLQKAAEAAKIGFWDWDLNTGKMSRTILPSGSGSPQSGEKATDIKAANIHPEDLEILKQKLNEALVAGTEYINEFWSDSSDGTVRWVEGRGQAIYDERGNATRTMGIVIDISEQKKIEESNRLREAELTHLSRISTMGNMASGLAHELNQPLGAILNYTGVCVNLARTQPVQMGKVLTALEEVANETRRAGAIIARIRSFASKHLPVSDAIDLNDLANKSVAMLDFELRHHNVNVRSRLEAAIPMVLADSIHIQQVIVNLIYNAMQAMSEMPIARRSLAIETKLVDTETVEFSVIDSGPGIPPENMARLFEPFFTTKTQGMGMGLNISRSIVESHAGRLFATANPSGGMKFTFRLPVNSGAMPWKRTTEE